MKNKLHPGVKWSFRIHGFYMFGALSIFLTFILTIPLGMLAIIKKAGIEILFLTPFIIIFLWLIFTLILSEIYARMSYNRWFYEFTDTNLMIEKGIIWKRYSNIPYERVQNIDIHRGIIARLCGFSAVNIQTAGYSGGYTSHGGGYIMVGEGYIPAVSVEGAEKIREFLMEKISKRHGQGL